MAIKIPTNRNGGRIPNDRSLTETACSCVYCGTQFRSSAAATACEKKHEAAVR